MKRIKLRLECGILREWKRILTERLVVFGAPSNEVENKRSFSGNRRSCENRCLFNKLREGFDGFLIRFEIHEFHLVNFRGVVLRLTQLLHVSLDLLIVQFIFQVEFLEHLWDIHRRIVWSSQDLINFDRCVFQVLLMMRNCTALGLPFFSCTWGCSWFFRSSSSSLFTTFFFCFHFLLSFFARHFFLKWTN